MCNCRGSHLENDDTTIKTESEPQEFLRSAQFRTKNSSHHRSADKISVSLMLKFSRRLLAAMLHCLLLDALAHKKTVATVRFRCGKIFCTESRFKHLLRAAEVQKRANRCHRFGLTTSSPPAFEAPARHATEDSSSNFWVKDDDQTRNRARRNEPIKVRSASLRDR